MLSKINKKMIYGETSFL